MKHIETKYTDVEQIISLTLEECRMLSFALKLLIKKDTTFSSGYIMGFDLNEYADKFLDLG